MNRNITNEMIDLMREAGRLAAIGPGRRFTKEDGSPVTEREVEIERFLACELARLRPDCGFRGEEGTQIGGDVPSGGGFWCVDPIDGTENYLRGDPHWGIVVGLLEGGRPTLGALLFPELGVLLVGIVGFGCAGDLGRGALEEFIPKKAMVPRFVRDHFGPRPAWSLESRRCTSWHFAALARGEAHVCCVGPGWKDWDVCAGLAILAELGFECRLVGGEAVDFGLESRSPLIAGAASDLSSFERDVLDGA